jgi:hypothetical protein
MLKRGINGTYIHVSKKHLQKYLWEFEYRHKLRHAPHLMFDFLLMVFAHPVYRLHHLLQKPSEPIFGIGMRIVRKLFLAHLSSLAALKIIVVASPEKGEA